tara:strand:- start:836 stop:1747 length:912 start_codon:yes stop_codon:yes gene_type:complete
MMSAVIIGLAQGVLEWIPVSSEGAVWLIINELESVSFETGVKYALFVHLATVPSSILVFRKQILYMVRNLIQNPSNLDSVTVFLAISFIVSGLFGLVIIKTVEIVSPLIGSLGMLVVGVFLLFTGFLSLFKSRYFQHLVSESSQIYDLSLSEKSTLKVAYPAKIIPSISDEIKERRSVYKKVLIDSLILGGAQSLAVLPGLSRSGITISLLLYRGVGKNQAVVMSFLMSIPASLAAALYSIFTNPDVSLSTFILIACLTAFIAGLVSIKIVLKFVPKLNLTFFIFASAIFVVCGALFDLLIIR